MCPVLTSEATRMADLALIVTLTLVEGRRLLLVLARVVCPDTRSRGGLDEVQIAILCQYDVFLNLFYAYLQVNEHVDGLELFVG